MARPMFCRGIVACDDCIKNCVTIHHLEQTGPSSTVSRFFKIMHGKNCCELLYLPPKFARNVRDLVGKKTQIEDSNGQKWTVKFSLVDGALAFLEGWHKFVEDHQLEHGELLVFNYTKHGHFVVQIYGLSACEILDFNRGRKHPKKRSRSDQETVFRDESHQIRNKRFTLTSKNLEDSSRMLSKRSRSDQETVFQDESHQIRNKRCTLTSNNMEDPSCMLSRDTGKYEVEDREIFFDLSNFEMGKNSSVAEKSETSLDRNITAVETQIREQIDMRNDTQMSIPLTDQKNNHLSGIATDAFQTKLPGSSNSSKGVPDDVPKFQAGEMENNCLHGISSDALQTKPPGNSDSSEGMPDDVSNFQAGEMENNHSCAIFSDPLQKKHSGDSDSRKGVPDDIKFQTGGTNNYRSCGIFSDTFLAKPSSNSDSSKDTLDAKFLASETENNCLHDISGDALQTKPPGNSDSSEGMPDDASKFQADEMENNHSCSIFSDPLQKKHSGDSDSRKGMRDDIKFQTGGTNNYRSCGIFSDTFLAKPSSNSDSCKDTLDEVSKFLACETSVSPPFVARDMKSPYICSSLLAESDHSTNSKHCDASATSSMHKDPFGKSPATFEKEVVILGEEVYDFLRISGEDGEKRSTLGMKCGQISSAVIKTEPDMDNVLDPARASGPFSAEVKSLAFLELPLCMPSIQGRRERGQGKVVYLKDSTKMLWPVLYPGKSGIRAITDGWRTFCKENSIKTGDICRFQIEKYMPSCVLKVDIIRKAGRSSEW